MQAGRSSGLKAGNHADCMHFGAKCLLYLQHITDQNEYINSDFL
jgi:hypothetical protein